MAVPSDLAGYVQGYIFSDASSATYDSTNKIFKDQAGYGDVCDMAVTVGTPTFQTVNGQKVWPMDNTCHARFIPPCPWQGSAIVVMKPVMGANGTIYPMIHGEATSIASNATLRMVRVTPTSYQHRWVTASAAATASANYTDTALKVSAFAMSQETRCPYSTVDGTTIVTGSAIADDGTGNKLSMSVVSAGAAGTTWGQTSRAGNLSGTINDAVVTSNTVQMCEIHYFKGNPLLTDPTTLAAVMATLRTKYGV